MKLCLLSLFLIISVQFPDWLVIPAISLDSPVVESKPYQYLKDGIYQVTQHPVHPDYPGWHTDSAKPGEGENIVINGHSNAGAKIFADLPCLAQGDLIYLRFDGRWYTYQVVELVKVFEDKDTDPLERHRNAAYILPTGYERLTLITCIPGGRLIVLAKPI